MLRRLRSLYSGVRPCRVDDEMFLKDYGSLASRDAVREKAQRELDVVQVRSPSH